VQLKEKLDQGIVFVCCCKFEKKNTQILNFFFFFVKKTKSFDVSSAVYGTHVYSRFSPSLLQTALNVVSVTIVNVVVVVVVEFMFWFCRLIAKLFSIQALPLLASVVQTILVFTIQFVGVDSKLFLVLKQWDSKQLCLSLPLNVRCVS
jgi:hypothetical protein